MPMLRTAPRTVSSKLQINVVQPAALAIVRRLLPFLDSFIAQPCARPQHQH